MLQPQYSLPFGPGALVPLKLAIASADSVGNDVYVAVVVDFGNGSSMTTVSKCVPVASNAHDADALAAAVGSANVAYSSSGLLCAIDNLPANGVQNCGQSVGNGQYDYWSYWHGAAGTWVYASNGPAEQSVSNPSDDVEGLRFQTDEPASSSDPAPAVAASYTQICNASTEVPPTQTSSAPATTTTTAGTSAAPSVTPTTAKSGSGSGAATTTTTAVGIRSKSTGARFHHHDRGVRRDDHHPGPQYVERDGGREPRIVVRCTPHRRRQRGLAGRYGRGLLQQPPPGRADRSRRRRSGCLCSLPMAAEAGRGMTRAAVPRRRSLHPLAWWLWAAGLAICAMRTNNPFLLALIGVVACVVVSARRSSAPWSRSITFFLRVGLLVIVIRIAIEILFGQRGVPGHVLFTLPQVPLPSWAAAVSIGGPVTLESILDAFVLGLQLAVILLCFGAANSLASPYRLLRSLPAVLYETGVAVTVALSFAPELVQSIGIVRQARRQRGIPTKGLRGMRGVAVPVLESALDRSLQLATSMDARGYGRRISVGKTSRRLASGATIGGLLLMAVGIYGVIDGGSLLGLGLPILAVAAVLCGVGLAVGGRRTARSRYRPDPWRQPEWIVAGSGLVALVTMSVAHAFDVPGLTVSFSPLEFPTIPLLPVVGILLALVPAIAAPNPNVVLRSAADVTAVAGESGAVTPRVNCDPVDADLSGVPT